jgi:hypothetical protein
MQLPWLHGVSAKTALPELGLHFLRTLLCQEPKAIRLWVSWMIFRGSRQAAVMVDNSVRMM